MSITTLVVIFSAPMSNSSGDLVVRASDWYSEHPGSIPDLYRTLYSCKYTLTSKVVYFLINRRFPIQWQRRSFGD